MNLLIKNISACVPLSPADEKIISHLFQEVVIAKDDHLLMEGQICRRVIFIEQGLVRYYLTNNGEEQTYYFNKEGEWVCDYPSFLHKAPAYANIQALETTTIRTISYDDLQTFYEQVTHGERFGRLAIEQVFTNVIEQISSLYNDKPQVRYQKFIQTYFDIAQRIPQYHIASYVGVKPQSLSRIRKRLIY